MVRKVASILNFFFWILLLLAFIFADNLGLSISWQSTPVHYGRYQIPAMIAAAVAVLVALVNLIGKINSKRDNTK